VRKTYPLRPEGKHPERVLEAVKHDIRKYMKRERRVPLPEGTDFWDFDCRLGTDKDSAEALHVAELTARLDALAKSGAANCYVELLAKPGHWQRRAPGAEGAEGAARAAGASVVTGAASAADASPAAAEPEAPSPGEGAGTPESEA
jgi:hypothetical protein